MDRGRNFHSNMEVKSCHDCVGSCCELTVDLTIDEYNELKQLGYKNAMQTKTDIFIKENPQYEKRREHLDYVHKDMFAVLKKNKKGSCVLLNQDTRFCTIYENRPAPCRDYVMNSLRCKSIKECIN